MARLRAVAVLDVLARVEAGTAEGCLMTRADRFTQLAAIQQTHDTLRCHVFQCAICATYYRVLLQRDDED